MVKDLGNGFGLWDGLIRKAIVMRMLPGYIEHTVTFQVLQNEWAILNPASGFFEPHKPK
jgi:hypothetical protein